MKEIKVGILALVALVAIIYMSLKISSNKAIFGEFVPYRILIDNAMGIFPNTQIKIAGINAGRIKLIEPFGNQALITFEVDSKFKVVANSKIRISSVGLLGSKYIEIIMGDGIDRLPPDSRLEIDSAGDLNQIMIEAGEIISNLNVIVSEVKDAILPANGDRPVSDFFSNLDNVTKGLNGEKLGNIVSNIEKVAAVLATDFKENGKIDELLTNLNSVSKYLEELARKGNDDDLATVLVGESSAEDFKESLSGLKKLINQGNRLKPTMNFMTSVADNSGVNVSASVGLYSSPQQLYILGVSNTEWGRPEIEEKIISTPSNPDEISLTSIREKNVLRYNLQVGRKFSNLTVLGGVFESTGGVGINYLIPDLGASFGMDLYDYRKDIGFNLRINANIRLWNVFYMQAQAMEITNAYRDYSVGLGFSFTDNELKGLVGFFL